ncbi:MAG TPA: prenyltransferase [Streptosporangiaceae bacterium]|nr:prenyltransferase [Streptosporangiaceae bacterium]
MTEESSPGETLPWSAVTATGEYIARMQQPAGGIAWPDGNVEAWDHVECAMAMSVCGLREPARRAYRWLREHQRDDGSWPRSTVAGLVTDPAAESHHAAYVAVGVWHEYLVTGDEGFALVMWPAVRRAVEWTLALRTPRGEVRWERDAAGQPGAYALLTGCSSIHQSLRCAVALAKLADDPRPEWELAADRLGSVVASCPEAFEDKSEFSMDWYYPVLGGALRGPEAERRIVSGWETFVVPGLGVRCVSGSDWVTAAETCELVMALDACGMRAQALEVFASVQHMREPDGSYWTGWQFVNQAPFPRERSTWTSAAVVLAADALAGHTGGAGIFRDAGAAPPASADAVAGPL